MNNDTMNAIKKALEFERDGFGYYSLARDKAGHLSTKWIFEILAEEEKKHMQYLVSLKDELKETGKWPSEITIKPDVDFKMIFRDAINKIDDNVPVSTSEVEALHHATEMERNGRTMYLELSGKASNSVEEELYKRLADWEESHAEFLDEYYDYFRDHGPFTDGAP